MTTTATDRIAGLLDGFRAGRRVALARAISIVEDERAGHERLIRELHADTGRAQRIGITGPPGAGKSTLTAALVTHYREAGETVGVVAVDPSSPFTGGALLGDRIRMNELATDPGVFIRSMATRGSLGGLALSTKEVADVLDAYGFDRILVETVGVGQSELEIAGAADSTVVVLVPESGDSVQAMKAGLMEISDIFVINKADRPGADRLAREVEMMLGLRLGRAFAKVPAHHGVDLGRAGRRRRDGQASETNAGDRRASARSSASASASGSDAPDGDAAWSIPVLKTTAAASEGIEELAGTLARHRAWLEASGELSRRRRARAEERVRQAVDREIRRRVWTEEGEALLARALPELEAGTTSPYDVAARIVRAVAG